MRNLKIIPISLCAAGMLALTGCASESGAEPSAGSTSAGDCWVSFEIAPAAAAAGQTSGSRAEESAGSATDKTINECRINDLVALLVDSDDDTVRGIAQGRDVVIASAGQLHKVTVNMGNLSMYEKEHKYRLYVFANLPGGYTDLSYAYGRTIEEVGKMVAGSLRALSSRDFEGSDGLPMSTLTDEAGKIQVSLKKETSYTSEKPYLVVQDPDMTQPGTLILTPLCARLDFVENAVNKAYTYPIGHAGEGNAANVVDVKVKLTHAMVRNAGSDVYLMPQGSASQFNLATPSTSVFGNSASFSVKSGAVAYVPEYVPTVSGDRLSYNALTYMQLDGCLVADAQCTGMDASVRKAITEAGTKKSASPKLYYFDDGLIQSQLTTIPHPGEANWHELAYDATVGGYKVSYRHGIRHDAGQGKNLEDGKVFPMEYAIVRNYLYQIEVQSIGALPHPNGGETDNVENTSEDISIRIAPPAKWSYHRGGTTVEFNKD